MSKVAIVTDSTAYIPDTILSGYPIFVAPLLVIWDDQSLRDGVDIMPAEFYARLKESKTMPSTSQVTPATFMEVYQRLLNEGYEILSVHIILQIIRNNGFSHSGKDAFRRCQDRAI